jgi:hypothetical protein
VWVTVPHKEDLNLCKRGRIFIFQLLLFPPHLGIVTQPLKSSDVS